MDPRERENFLPLPSFLPSFFPPVFRSASHRRRRRRERERAFCRSFAAKEGRKEGVSKWDAPVQNWEGLLLSHAYPLFKQGGGLALLRPSPPHLAATINVLKRFYAKAGLAGKSRK